MKAPAYLFLAAGVWLASAAQGCGSSTYEALCSDTCSKAETCGDVDSVKADQCRAKCSANADVTNAALDACTNKADIVTATDQCLSRECSDYAKCLLSLPSCSGGKGPTGSIGDPSNNETSSSNSPDDSSCAQFQIELDKCCGTQSMGDSAKEQQCEEQSATAIASLTPAECQSALDSFKCQ